MTTNLSSSEVAALEKLDEAFAAAAITFAVGGRSEVLAEDGDMLKVAYAIQDLNDNLGRTEFLPGRVG